MLAFNTARCQPETAHTAQCRTGHAQNDGQTTVKTILKPLEIT
jgi:hypothetical protein